MGPASTLWKTATSGGGTRFFAGCIDGSNPAVVWLPSLERCPDLAQSHRYSVHLKDLDRLAGPLRGQARSHRGLCASLRNWSAGRPPSRASSLPQKSKSRSAYTNALHHSSGRALARLQLLILIHPPPRQAEWRCSSGDWRAAPFDAVEHIACRCQRSQPEGDAPGGMPERRNPEPQRGAVRKGRDFLVPFVSFDKRDSP